MTNILIIFYTCYWSVYFGVSPAFALATFHIESRDAGHEFRIGKIGKSFYGPAGINQCFVKKYPEILTLSGNIKIGVRALRGRDKVRVLRRYNPQATQAYLRAVMGAERKYRRMICR